MRYVFLIFLTLSLNVLWGFSYLSCAAISIWIWFLLDLFDKSNDHIAFKEFILAIFGLNFLFSPAMSYLMDQRTSYRMKIPEEEYFTLAIPCMLLLRAGMNIVKTRIFEFDFRTIQLQAVLNRSVLLSWLYVGTLIRFLTPLLPSDLAFLFYLISGVRFVAAYGLFVMNARQFKWHLIGILFVELLMALQQGMFHDLVMWIIFFGLFWVYIKKPSRNLKLMLSFGGLLAIFIIQVVKADYRTRSGSLDEQEMGLERFQDVVEKNVENEQGLFNTSNTTNSLTRANQAWILASTVSRMNRVQDYQGMELIKKYAEAAFLPRFLAPTKLKAGDKAIFNQFSGHRVNSGTSMGLGFFADGYIAYGQMGAYVFAFLLGFIFALIFKLVENWARISPFFILLMFPILHYAVRPDCETQTIMGHIVKGVFAFGCLMWYYSNYFSRRINEARQEEALARVWQERLAKTETKA